MQGRLTMLNEKEMEVVIECLKKYPSGIASPCWGREIMETGEHPTSFSTEIQLKFG